MLNEIFNTFTKQFSVTNWMELYNLTVWYLITSCFTHRIGYNYLETQLVIWDIVTEYG